jgi:hypothetical protein
LTAIPYNVYRYEIASSENPDEIGQHLIFGFYEAPITQVLTLDAYNRIMANDPSAPKLDKVFNHTIGAPLSYPSSSSDLSNVEESRRYTFNASDDFIGAGLGQGLTSYLTIEVTEEMETSLGFSIGFEFELVATTAGVKLGAGFGFENSNTFTKTVGKSMLVGGAVRSIPDPIPSGCKNFRWNLAWYNYIQNGQEFPVVNFLVRE